MLGPKPRCRCIRFAQVNLLETVRQHVLLRNHSPYKTPPISPHDTLQILGVVQQIPRNAAYDARFPGAAQQPPQERAAFPGAAQQDKAPRPELRSNSQGTESYDVPVGVDGFEPPTSSL